MRPSRSGFVRGRHRGRKPRHERYHHGHHQGAPSSRGGLCVSLLAVVLVVLILQHKSVEVGHEAFFGVFACVPFVRSPCVRREKALAWVAWDVLRTFACFFAACSNGRGVCMPGCFCARLRFHRLTCRRCCTRLFSSPIGMVLCSVFGARACPGGVARRFGRGSGGSGLRLRQRPRCSG